MMVTEVRTNTLLEINHLSVDYDSTRGTVHAVNDVSFTIERGQIFGLAGESGSGKSTLAYAIARLLQPPAVVTQGQVLYHPHRAAPSAGTLPEYSRGDPCGRPGDGGRPGADTRPGADSRPGGSKDDAVGAVLALNPDQLRAFRWRDLSIVFQSAMNDLNPVRDIGQQITNWLNANNPLMTAPE